MIEMTEINKTKRKRHRVGPLTLPVLIGPELGAWQYHRAAALVVLLATLMGLTLVSALIMLAVQIFFDFSLLKEIGIALALFAIMLLQTWIYYRFSNLRVSANLFTYSYFLMTLALVVIGGGYDSPLTIFLFCCVVVTFRISERADGIMNAFFVLLAGAALTAMKILEVETPNLLPGLDRSVIFSIVWLSVLLTFAACLATYHHQHEASR
jgi:hypothetical protein